MLQRFLVSLLLFAQVAVTVTADNHADSLRQKMETTNTDARSKAYDEMYSFYYFNGEIDKALEVLGEWADFEKQRGNVENESQARWRRIAAMSNYDLNEELLAEAPAQIEWFEQHKQWERYYNTWESKANAYLYTKRTQTALHEARLMYDDAQKRNNDFGRAVSCQLSGIIYDNMNQSKMAVENFQRALALVKRQTSHSDIAFTVYDYLSQSLDQEDSYQQELDLTYEWEKAIIDYRQQPENQPTAMRGSELSCLIQRSCALKGLGRLSEAQQTLDRAQRKMNDEKLASPVTLYRLRLVKAKLLIAQDYPQQALELLDSIKAEQGDLGGDIDITRAKTLMTLGRYEEAADMYRSKYEENDSVFSRDMRTQLDELSTLYRLDESKLRAKAEQEQQRQRYITIIISVIAMALLLIYIYRQIATKKLKKAYNQLEEANEQLTLARQRAEDSSKMKSDFIKSISHEIRTPLNILSGFTQVITTPDNSLPPEELSNIHRRINENTDRIVKLVNKMLELSDSNSHEPIERKDSLSAATIVENAIRLVKLTSTDSVELRWNAEEPIARTTLTTHRKYAVRALACLLENAEKFTKKGHISITLRRNQGRIIFSVEDTGTGIPKGLKEDVFEEFIKADQYTDGAGIGLPVARSIARRLGGDIKLEATEPGKGSTFIMQLPTS